MMKNKNALFMILIIVVLIGSLVGLSFLTKKQKEDVTKGLIPYNPQDYKVDGWELDKQPMIGKEDAPVSMVLFSDFSCPHCKEWEAATFDTIQKELIDSGKAKLYFINYQFMNASSYKAGVAAESVYRQNPKEFFKFYKGIYTLQNPAIPTWANNSSLLQLAKDLKLDINYDTLEKDMKEYKYIKDVHKDRAIGQKYGVQGTPSLFINEQMVKNIGDVKGIIKAVDDAAKQGEKKTEKSSEDGKVAFTPYNPSDYKVTGFDLEKQPVIGKEDAPINMTLFSDFSCPDCKNWDNNVFNKIKKDFIDTGKVKFHFINYQFLNESSYKAGVASESVYHQNPKEFLTFFNGIYSLQDHSNPKWANEDSLVKLAKDLKLDINYDTLQKDIQSYTYLKDVHQDRAIGQHYGVQGTPTLFINDTMVKNGEDYDAIAKQVNDLLEKGGKK